ncbi:MAG: D-glucuronyl C5-epimerase family protein [Scytonematopsis contorta HA4267-MV1]|jgi:hypothetical protein|nr:D-glucuronyl C5-epimerase family protein [Scytonematopsis contorta HA4267-MV1]
MNNILSKLSLYSALSKHWLKMLGGKSYWHVPQDTGKCFVPGQLSGYYNDLSHKKEWHGLVDANGIPLNTNPKGETFYFPMTLFQKALGHWDTWLLSGCKSAFDYEEFLKIAQWAVETQNLLGGWETWKSYGLLSALPYSAMSQGEGISVLTRAFSVTQDKVYLKTAWQALTFLLTPVEEGGTSRYVSEGLVLEEFPSNITVKTVLNGWVFALYGLYDFILIENDPDIQKAFDDCLKALMVYLPKFNAGFWSFYDTNGSIASPFYHQLHINQLKTLELTFPEHRNIFAQTRKTFEEQNSSDINQMRAVLLKGYQKVCNPPEAVLQ